MLAELFGGDPTPYIGGGTVIALVSISVTLLVRTAKVVPQTYIDQIEALERAQVALRKENVDLRVQHSAELLETRRERQRAERRTDRMIRAMREAGVPIPEEVWNDH